MSLFGKNDSKTEHQWVEDRLSAYLDGELSSRERNTVDHHLARCQECQRNLRTLRQTVHLTQQLPTVPVPRVFTIPAPAQQPARARQRRWSMGLLQGATALVALLLVFAVAGDFVLTGLTPTREAAPVVMKEQAVVDTEATQVAEAVVSQTMQVQAEPSAAEAGAAAEKSASEAAPEPSPSAEPALAAPRPAAPQEPTTAPLAAPAAAPTATPEVSGMGGMGFEPPAEGTQAASAEGIGGGESLITETTGVEAATEAPSLQIAASAPASETETVQTYSVTAAPGAAASNAADTAEPAAGAVQAVPPLPAPGQEPTVVANVPALEQQAKQVREAEQERGTGRDPLVVLVQTAELVLGGAFILLATTTIAVMLRWRKSR